MCINVILYGKYVRRSPFELIERNIVLRGCILARYCVAAL
jgi:hypothetical protein